MDETPPLPPEPERRPPSTNSVLLALTAVGTLALGGSIGAIWYLANRVDVGEVSDGSFLQLTLKGTLSDEPVTGGLFDDPSDAPPTVTELAEALRAAAEDDRIDGLFLVVDGAAGGWASWQELRGAVEAFQAADKPCLAYSPSMYSNGSYYLASVCDTVAMAPTGVVMVNGLAMEMSYYAGTLEWLGIEPEFEHVGDFKSAIETFERTEPSESAAEAYEHLIDSTWAQLVDGIAAGRDLDSDAVRELIDHPRITPQSAVDRGMVDVLAWPDAVVQHAHRVGEDGWADLLAEPVDEVDRDNLTRMKEYIKGFRADARGSGDRIAVVQAQGNIVSGGSGGGLFGDDGNLTDGEFADWMEEARDDDSVKAVVVRVNSPGGSGLASSLMWREVARTQRAGKPVVVSMGDLAASGGYMMSCNADWIVAQPGTITGSIGVFGGKFDMSGAWEKLGMTSHTFKRGELSDLFSPNAGFSEEGRGVYKEFLSTFYYDVFLDQVSEGRGMEVDAVHEVAQGRVWTGEQALGHGLVDELGGLHEALAKAAELAEIDDYGVSRVPRAKGFMELLAEDLEGADASLTLELPLDAAMRADLALFQNLHEMHGVAAFLPGRPTLR
jgi:protease-4